MDLTQAAVSISLDNLVSEMRITKLILSMVFCSTLAGATDDGPWYTRTGTLTDMISLVEHYRCYDAACTRISPVPTSQEVLVDSRRFPFDSTMFEIRDLASTENDVFLLISNNYGLFLARLCECGEVEFMAEFEELGLESIISFVLRSDGTDIVVEFEYGANEEGFEPDHLKRRLRTAGVHGGCASVKPDLSCPPQKLDPEENEGVKPGNE